MEELAEKTEEKEIACCDCNRMKYDFECTCKRTFLRTAGEVVTLGLGLLGWNGCAWDCKKTGHGWKDCDVLEHCKEECVKRYEHK